MHRWLAITALVVAGAGLVGVIVFAVMQARVPEAAQQTAEVAGSAETPKPTAGPEKPGIEVRGLEVVRRDEEGNVVWRAEASGSIEVDEEQRAARAQGVNWVLERGGLDRWRLRAPVMQADYDTARLTFSEGVSIEGERSESAFSAERIVYEFDTQKLIGSGKVSLRRGRFTATAGELVIDNRARKVRLRGGVRFRHTGVKIPG